MNAYWMSSWAEHYLYSNININAIGTYTVNYSVLDSSGNQGVNTRTVNVVDQTAPVLSLIGNNPEFINQNDTYNNWVMHHYWSVHDEDEIHVVFYDEYYITEQHHIEDQLIDKLL
mgnify:CR=1 FL=1